MPLSYIDSVGTDTVISLFDGSGLGEFGVLVSGGGGANALGIANFEAGHTGLPVILVKNFPVAIAEQGVNALPSNFAPTVGGANAIGGHTADPMDFTQVHILPAVAANQGHTADSAIQSVVLVVVNASQGETGDPVVFTQLHILPAVLATQGETVDPIILVKNLLQANATMGHDGLAVEFPLGGMGVANAGMGHTAGRID